MGTTWFVDVSYTKINATSRKHAERIVTIMQAECETGVGPAHPAHAFIVGERRGTTIYNESYNLWPNSFRYPEEHKMAQERWLMRHTIVEKQ